MSVIPAWMRPDTVTIVRPFWDTDARGNRIPRYDDRATREPVTGCTVQPGGSTEDTIERNTTEVVWRVFVYDTALDVRATDAVEFGGTMYAVNAAPRVWDGTPGGLLDHVQIDLIGWEG